MTFNISNVFLIVGICLVSYGCYSLSLHVVAGCLFVSFASILERGKVVQNV